MNSATFLEVFDSQWCQGFSCFKKMLFLFYLVLFYYYLLEACLFANERQKSSGLSRKELGEKEGVETIIRIHHLRKIYDFNKRKNE